VIFAGEGLACGGASGPGGAIGNEVAKNPFKGCCCGIDYGVFWQNLARTFTNGTEYESAKGVLLAASSLGE